MIENSGFLSDNNELTQISTSLSDVVILGQSATNIYGRANRFGKRWFFKGVAPDTPDSAITRQRLLKEFDIQIGLVHPAIERVVSIETIEGFGQCIVAEWIEGETLESALHKQPLSAADRHHILYEIIDAVSYLHSQGIVHRDLKPSNIMIRNNGQSAVIIDFGLADTDAHLYQKTPAGTEGYASPRQYHEHTPYTGDDIHALGVIMRQLCPELSSIATRCVNGKYPTAEALRRAISRHYRARRIIASLSAAALIITILTTLLIYISSLRNTAAALQSEIVAMTDSVAALRSTAQTSNTALRDSLSTITNQLATETSLRHDREQRQSQIDELKTRLNKRLDKTFQNFRATEDPSDPDNMSMVRLTEQLGRAQNDFMANEIPFALSNSESSELIYSYVTHYNSIIKQWEQILKQHRPNASAE